MMEDTLLPKMTPQFCKSLCQFIETSVTDGFQICKFQLYTWQINMILKACRNLKYVKIAGCKILNKEEQIRMEPLNFCFKDEDSKVDDFRVKFKIIINIRAKISN